MTTLNVHFKGQTHPLLLSDADAMTISELQAKIARVVHVPQDVQRLFQKRRRLDCSDASKPLTDVCDCSSEAEPLFLVAGASRAQIQDMQTTQDAVHKEMLIRENRRVVDISKRNQGLQARDAVSTSYRFHAIEPLKNFADEDKAREILDTLANDRGILAVMAKHKWSVGVLAEMPPDGKVGVDPVCVLGLNQNKGQKILLRLRTDDLQGFRKFLSIKKVLYHELSHNVHSEHDSKFYQLMRQVEKECNDLDWTRSRGASVGGSRASMHHTDEQGSNSASGQRLGGGFAGTSRLLRSVPVQPASTPEQRLTPPSPTQTVEQEQQPCTTEQSEDIEMEEVQAEIPEPIPSSQPTQIEVPKPASPVPPLSHEKAFDEEVATLAMSDRERRIHDAVRHLQAHYSTKSIVKAVNLLHKIVSNILSHPADAKFRSIRKANRLFEDQVAKFPECIEFLLALGFEDQFDKLVLVREDPALLWIGREVLPKLPQM